MRLDYRYVAGFLDADGSIYIARFARKEDRVVYFYPRVSFISQNLGVLLDLKETVGGRIRMEDCGSGCYQLVLDTNGAAKCLRNVLQYLRIKSDQARAVLEFVKLIDGQKERMSHMRGKDAKMSDEEYAERVALYTKVKELNKRDSLAFRKNRVNSVNTPEGAIPSQAAAANDSAEGVTTSQVSANNNPDQECPARKGRDSLSSTVLQ